MILSRIRILLEPAIRRCFHLYWRLTRGMTFGVRALVLDAQGRVFLVKHSYVPGWYLPGGGVEAGESATDALAREIGEETGAVLTAPGQLFGVYRHPAPPRRDHVMLYVCRAWEAGPGKPRWPEILAADLFPCDRLPEDAVPSTRARVREVLFGDPVAIDW